MEEGLWRWKDEESYPEWIDLLVVSAGSFVGIRFDGGFEAKSDNLTACYENRGKWKLWERLA